MGYKIAVTGGIGSGKSTVIKILQEMGHPVFSCDKIYAELLHDPTYIHKIAKLFPAAVQNGAIDKRRLADVVFHDEAQRKKLNDLAHPLVMATLYKRMEKCDDDFVFAEVPLLFENGFEKQFDKVFVVYRDLQTRIEAVCARDGLDENAVKERIRTQFDYDDKNNQLYLHSIGAFILENDKGETDLKKSIDTYLQCL